MEMVDGMGKIDGNEKASPWLRLVGEIISQCEISISQARMDVLVQRVFELNRIMFRFSANQPSIGLVSFAKANRLVRLWCQLTLAQQNHHSRNATRLKASR